MEASQLFAEVMEGIAACLDGWELGEIDGSGGRLLGPDGAGLSVRSNRYAYTVTGRLEISCHFPYDPDYGTFCPRDGHGYIQTTRTCAAAKSPAQIAQYIQQQVLPKYLPLYEEEVRVKQAWLERRAAHQRQLEEIAEIAQADPPQHGSTRVHIGRESGSFYGHVEVYQDAIRLDVRGVPWDVGVDIIKLLANNLCAKEDKENGI